jgi:hypothetical protein
MQTFFLSKESVKRKTFDSLISVQTKLEKSLLRYSEALKLLGSCEQLFFFWF